MADTPNINAKGWLTFAFQVLIAVFIINMLFDLAACLTGSNVKKYFNRPITTFYPGKTAAASTTTAQSR